MKPTTPTPSSYDLARAEADYPNWKGLPLRTIIICSYPRSGSTLLGEAIYFANGFGCPLEYFHVGFQPKLADRWNCDSISSYLNAVYMHRTDPSGTLAIKLFWRDLIELYAKLRDIDPALAISQLDALPSDSAKSILRGVITQLFPNPSFVYLNRKDEVRQAISAYIASQTNQWRSLTGHSIQDQNVKYDYQRITQLMASQRESKKQWTDFFANSHWTPYCLTYENLLKDYDESVRNVFSHLGIPQNAPTQRRLKRQANSFSEVMVLRFLRDARSTLSKTKNA